MMSQGEIFLVLARVDGKEKKNQRGVLLAAHLSPNPFSLPNQTQVDTGAATLHTCALTRTHTVRELKPPAQGGWPSWLKPISTFHLAAKVIGPREHM